MYQSISVQVAAARHIDMVARAQRERVGRQARALAPAGQPRARRRSGPWHLMPQLRPQAQS
jgi:hypothetical protein